MGGWRGSQLEGSDSRRREAISGGGERLGLQVKGRNLRSREVRQVEESDRPDFSCGQAHQFFKVSLRILC